MTDIAAAIGIGQMKRVDEVTERRRVLAGRYLDAFAKDGWDVAVGVELPAGGPGVGEEAAQTNWHMFQIVLPGQWTTARFQARMKERWRIGVGHHYPPIHLFRLYRDTVGSRDGMFPVAERIGKHIATLPLFVGMAKEDVDRVVAAVRATLAKV